VRLKSFEAHGFKSFADKVSVNFENGITAIVGPNGSGKSNISDAIRWVLGEQSIKYLRGTKMEDVIFAGSSARRPMGMADVTLVFDNSDHYLPVDFDEVSIHRRVYRSGESEYQINNKNCRLKDIVALLADTGLGRGSMSIIGQNKIDEILNSRPEERRAIFEETAGIAKYRLRKKEALRKLDDTSNNLLRIHDIQSEIFSQLKPLEKAAEKVRVYHELDAAYTKVRVTELVRKMDGLAAEKKQLEEKLARWDVEASALTEKIHKAQEAQAVQEKKLSDHDASFGVYQNEVRQQQDAMRGFESQQSVYRERVRQGHVQIEQMTNVLARLEKEIQQNKENLTILTEEYDRQEAQYRSIKETVDKAAREKDELTQAVARAEQEVQDSQNKNFERMRELVMARNELTGARQEEEQVHRKVEVLKARMEETENTSHELSLRMTSEQEELESNRQRQDEVREKGTALKQQLDQLAAALQKATQELAQKQRERDQKKTRLNVLQHMEQEHEGFSRGVKSILNSHAAWRSGVCGVVAELFEVKKEYITAIETALGGALQDIITRDAETAKSAIRYLKMQQAGRATFLPLDTIRPRFLSAHEKTALSAEGIIGIASSLVSCTEEIRPAADFLLGQVLVADTLDHALAAARKADMRVRVVTLDGDVVFSGGSLSGGQKQQSRSFLSRRQEMENLEGEVAALQQAVTEQEGVVGNLKQRQQDIVIDRNACADKFQKLAISIATLTTQIEQTRKEVSQISEQLMLEADEKSEASRAFLAVEQKIAALVPKVKALEDQDVKEKEDSRAREEALTRNKSRLEIVGKKHQDAVISFNTIKAQLDALSGRIGEIDRHGESTVKEMDRQKEQIGSTEAMIEKAEAEIVSLQKKVDALKKGLEGSEEKTQAFMNERKALQDVRETLVRQVVTLQQQEQALQQKKHQTEMDQVRKSSEYDSLDKQLEENYRLTVEEARSKGLEEGSESELKKQEILLSRKIEELGPVNLAAEEDFRSAKERYEFLTKQYNDMVNAKQQLETVISGINSDMTKRFREAFDKINDYFGKCYEKLFGGGKARLVIQNEQNLLDTGIEIEAQPPGKKMRNLSLFSGGERALTVIALLFALLTYHPAPFVILDEIDAPLDETNIDRFAEFLREYGEKTQFIIITHRKGTMEAADTLHGVTMGESGVSRVLSVKLSEVAAS
jgi:chromosome segregation protein